MIKVGNACNRNREALRRHEYSSGPGDGGLSDSLIPFSNHHPRALPGKPQGNFAPSIAGSCSCDYRHFPVKSHGHIPQPLRPPEDLNPSPTAQCRVKQLPDLRAPHIATNELHDLLHRRTRLEYTRDIELFEPIDVLIRDDAAHQNQNIINVMLSQKLHNPWH